MTIYPPVTISPDEPAMILHLSDLHFGTVEDAERWRGQLAEDWFGSLGVSDWMG